MEIPASKLGKKGSVGYLADRFNEDKLILGEEHAAATEGDFQHLKMRECVCS